MLRWLSARFLSESEHHRPILPLLGSPDSPPEVEDDPYMVVMAVDSVAAFPERIEDSVFNEVVGTFSSYKTGDAIETYLAPTEIDSQSTQPDSDSPFDMEPPAPNRRRVSWLDPVVANNVPIERMYINYMRFPRKVKKRDVYRPPLPKEFR